MYIYIFYFNKLSYNKKIAFLAGFTHFKLSNPWPRAKFHHYILKVIYALINWTIMGVSLGGNQVMLPSH